MNGIIVIDKPAGMTSQGVVSRVKRLLGAKKAGHTGTLDPMATGVLPVMVGNASKAGEYMICSEKHYLATLTLGLTTDTEDITGTVLSRSDEIPDEAQVIAAVERFKGEIMQVPPMYSALKIGGEKLVDLARKGVEVERAPRPVTVFRLNVSRLGAREYALDVVCSKGTYIRTLCADIGKALGCGGVMSSLRRTEAAGFTTEDAVTFEQIEAASPEERSGMLRPVETVFMKYERVLLPPFFARLAHNGLPVYQKKIGVCIADGTGVRLYDEKGFFAFAVAQTLPDGSVLRPQKQFPKD